MLTLISRDVVKGFWPLWSVIGLLLLALIWPNSGLDINLLLRNMPPSLTHPFGTDWLGRDMLTRSLKALLTSLSLAGFAVVLSSVLALIIAACAMTHRWVRQAVELLVDVSLSLPHLLLLILLSLAFGGSSIGLIAAIALSHWPRIARLLMFEMHSVSNTVYFQLALQFGQPRWRVFCRHLVPYIIPQWLTGALVMLPFALSHMAALTFLGFGLDPSSPSMGVILSQASRYFLAGDWWLAVLPGALLVVTLLLLSAVAHQITLRIRGQHHQAKKTSSITTPSEWRGNVNAER
ncbi:ABC transporter permease [Photobacterium nomapromontoriensis]|uniref:ABC transporter permease n=1 Tax=Photobacterium nomapromontoriensis TaxID=2910237 RepID=UPI003D0FF307